MAHGGVVAPFLINCDSRHEAIKACKSAVVMEGRYKGNRMESVLRFWGWLFGPWDGFSNEDVRQCGDGFDGGVLF